MRRTLTTLCLLLLSLALFAEESTTSAILWAGMADALNRAGSTASFRVLLKNQRDTATPEGTLFLALPAGIQADASTPTEVPVATLDPYNYRFVDFRLTADAPTTGDVVVTLSLPDREPETYTAPIVFAAPLGLPKADYVPVPQPISTGPYKIGALYFPGWDGESNGGWQRILRRTPERKPMLGWYDEGNPEAIDWHIKWLVENGIQYLAVDWYWSHGSDDHLDHFLSAYRKCRYRSYIKFALMWANHLGPGAHTEEDTYAAARRMVEKYFSMPEYVKIDGKPLLMIWSVAGFDRDLKELGGAARANEIFQEVAKEAGYPGVHICGMKLPEAVSKQPAIQKLKDQGYESTFIYRYRDPIGQNPRKNRFSFQELVDTSPDYWWERFCVGTLPFFVNITSGWDDRPWNNNREIYGKTPQRFKELCQKAKAFVDDMHLEEWLMLGPVNEWGEGSYIEPCTEYGFGMYEAVRDTFGVKPAGGWPLNYAPSDVGLGPYDLPDSLAEETLLGDWGFEDRLHAWRGRMGIRDTSYADGAMSFTTGTTDPILSFTPAMPFQAAKYHTLTVRFKASPKADGTGERAQIFWSIPSEPCTETKAVNLNYKATGEYQELVFQLDSNPLWKGTITGLRFDPLSRKDAQITIDRIWLE